MAKRHGDLTGQTFGKLTVLSCTVPRGKRAWLCRCDCGVEKEVGQEYLLRSPCPSCGCEDRRRKSERATTHGAAAGQDFSLSYWTWRGMKSRCYVQSDSMFRYYGGRGITICPRWLTFTSFIADMGERPSRAHTIERIDTDGNYEPGNCRWATRTEQMRNMRRNVYVETPEGRMLAADLARHFGILPANVIRWKRWGWSDERIYECASGGPIARGSNHARQRPEDAPVREPTGRRHMPLAPAQSAETR